PVRVLRGAERRGHDLAGLLGVHRVLGVDELAQGAALHVLHHDVGGGDVGPGDGGLLLLAGVVHGHDRGMVQRGGAVRLPPEALLEVRVTGQVGAQHLHGDRAVQAGVLGEEHLGHAPGAEDPAQAVASAQDHLVFAHSTPVLVPWSTTTAASIVVAGCAPPAARRETSVPSSPAAPSGIQPSPPAIATRIARTTKITSTRPGSDMPANCRPVVEVPRTVREEFGVSTSSKAPTPRGRASRRRRSPRAEGEEPLPAPGAGAGEAAERAELAESAEAAERAEPAELAERPERELRRGAEPAEAAERAEGPEAPERCRIPRPRPDSGSGIAAVRVPVGEVPVRRPCSPVPLPPEPAAPLPPGPPVPAPPVPPGRTRFSPVQSWSSTRVTGIAPVVKRGSTPRWIASRIRATAAAERGRFAGALASIIITSRRRSAPIASGSSGGCCLTCAIAISTWLEPVKGRLPTSIS